MRITSGIYRGRVLKTPKNRDIRPTSDKVRGAIMNILRGRGCLEGAHVLDICCGTGALGLEALSNASAHCTFIDKHKNALTLAKENAYMLGTDEQSTFIQVAAENLPPRGRQQRPADLVFLDPPYHQNLVPKIISALQVSDWVKDNAIYVVETAKDESLQPFTPFQEKNYGDTKVSFLQIRIPE